MEKLKTKDGSETLFNPLFKEAYHSIKAGAFTESLYKFVYPCGIDKLAERKNSIKILDVGFGLGYNVASAVYVASQTDKNSKLDIISVEIDESIITKLNLVNYPLQLKPIIKEILKGKVSEFKIGKETYKVYEANSNKFSLKIIFGDGRNILKNLAEERYLFDAVFYDAFSPKVNAEMWTLDIFNIVFKLMTKEAILATYSAALSVRKALLDVGFKIGLVEPVGRKSYSTVATKGGEIPPLPEKEKIRIKTSPYACVMRDKTLSTPREIIYNNWLKEVEMRKKLFPQSL